jgi:hypothetical protein
VQGDRKSVAAPTGKRLAPIENHLAPAGNRLAPTPSPLAPTSALKDRLLAEIRTTKSTLYNIAVAMAQRIDVTDERITFTFAANQNVARMQLEQNRDWLQGAVERLTGRQIPVVAMQAETPSTPPAGEAPRAAEAPADTSAARDLKAEAMSSSAVQAVLDVFPAEIRDVEEMK